MPPNLDALSGDRKTLPSGGVLPRPHPGGSLLRHIRLSDKTRAGRTAYGPQGLPDQMPQLKDTVGLTLEATSCSWGTTAVCTRFPLTTSRISMESGVKASR